MNTRTAKEALEKFLSFPLNSGDEILRLFGTLPNAVSHIDGNKKNFVYIPGERNDRVLLVAHVDTVWDSFYCSDVFEQTLHCGLFGKYKGVNPDCGIGADDRAGCAILWLLKDSGHSLLIVDGEEHGQIGSNHIKNEYPEIYDELNSHSYMLQFDRRNAKEYKVYKLPVTTTFISFIEKSTNYKDAGNRAKTDIVVLCRDICGANLSIGYYNEHTEDEYLDFADWYNTLVLAEKLLSQEQQKYLLDTQ